MKRERRLFYACSLTALAVHVLARTTGLFNNNAVAYKPTIMIFMDMIQTHDDTWQPGNQPECLTSSYTPRKKGLTP